MADNKVRNAVIGGLLTGLGGYAQERGAAMRDRQRLLVQHELTMRAEAARHDNNMALAQFNASERRGLLTQEGEQKLRQAQAARDHQTQLAATGHTNALELAGVKGDQAAAADARNAALQMDVLNAKGDQAAAADQRRFDHASAEAAKTRGHQLDVARVNAQAKGALTPKQRWDLVRDRYTTKGDKGLGTPDTVDWAGVSKHLQETGQHDLLQYAGAPEVPALPPMDQVRPGVVYRDQYGRLIIMDENEAWDFVDETPTREAGPAAPPAEAPQTRDASRPVEPPPSQQQTAPPAGTPQGQPLFDLPVPETGAPPPSGFGITREQLDDPLPVGRPNYLTRESVRQMIDAAKQGDQRQVSTLNVYARNGWLSKGERHQLIELGRTYAP